jgi:hypothetical protein
MRAESTICARSLIVVLLLVVGCQCSSGPEVVIATYSPARGSEDVALDGTLAVHKGCVMVRTQEAEYVMLVWPAGFTVGTGANGQTTVVRPDGSVAATVGDHVTLGGGPTGPATEETPPECETKHMFRVWDVAARQAGP